ncbi:MAG: cobalamin-dependent protein [Nitrospirae bacterium]|nr:cobalamin-dependent protein [Nitrospirota bacterium]
MINNEQEKKSVMDAILKGERDLVNTLLDDYAASRSYRTAMNEVLEPVLEEIGSRWTEENLSLAQGYIAGKVAEDLLMKIHNAEKDTAAKQAAKVPVVIGNIEDDYHSLGRKLVSVFLQSAGWQVYDLGNDVTAEEFVDKAVEKGARVIGVSAMMYTTAENIRKVRDELDRQNLSGKIKLAVGGAVFKLRPELAAEVGGDGTAANGFQASQLFEKLWEESLREVPL